MLCWTQFTEQARTASRIMHFLNQVLVYYAWDVINHNIPLDSKMKPQEPAKYISTLHWCWALAEASWEGLLYVSHIRADRGTIPHQHWEPMSSPITSFCQGGQSPSSYCRPSSQNHSPGTGIWSEGRAGDSGEVAGERDGVWGNSTHWLDCGAPKSLIVHLIPALELGKANLRKLTGVNTSQDASGKLKAYPGSETVALRYRTLGRALIIQLGYHRPLSGEREEKLTGGGEA